MSQEAPGHYSKFVIANGLIFTSGVLPLLDRATKSVPETIEEQALLALEGIEKIIQESGSDRSDIIKTTAYICRVDDWSKVNGVYQSFFADHKPARSIIPVSGLHFGCLIEIEAIAKLRK